MYMNILVPVDGGPVSDKALDEAAEQIVRCPHPPPDAVVARNALQTSALICVKPERGAGG